jgi:hypothetical protein
MHRAERGDRLGELAVSEFRPVVARDRLEPPSAVGELRGDAAGEGRGVRLAGIAIQV